MRPRVRAVKAIPAGRGQACPVGPRSEPFVVSNDVGTVRSRAAELAQARSVKQTMNTRMASILVRSSFARSSAAWLALGLLPGCGDDGGGRDSATGSDTAIPETSGGSTTDASETDGTTSSADTDPDPTQGETTGEPPQTCEQSSQCAQEEVCAGGVCVPSDGPCQSDADCGGDTFCCAQGCLPEGEEGGWCVPYGLGDVNEQCLGEVVIGLFEPDVQCEWTTPAAGDAFPDHANVLTTPLVAQLPNDSGAAGEIVLVAYNGADGGAEAGYGSDPAYFGVIRILNGQTCEVVENVDDPANRIVAASPPAIGDLDGDGTPEIVAQRAVSGLVAFSWNAAAQAYETLWVATETDLSAVNRWDGPAIHDLDDDGFPEVISGGEVFDGATGARLNPGQIMPYASPGSMAILGDVDDDGIIELLSDEVYSWNVAMSRWDIAWPGGPGGRHYAFADFGTPGATPAEFDDGTLDGIAEIVTVQNGMVLLHTLDGQQLLSAPIVGGGPPTIGDFDNDGFPEIASAGGTAYLVFDLDCAGAPAGCAGDYVRWTQPSQDSSSQNTGSSIFDFEGDGQAEAVYADECFVRVYDGSSGEVLYSAARTSCTWYENPIVADPDFDDNTEILVGSNTNCNIACPLIDPIHRGVRCEEDAECPSGICDAGFCRCTSDDECTDGHSCQAPPPGTAGAGNTCRAEHPPDIALTGVRVLRDRLDRWASSRPLWNQHAYSITNIEDDLSIPASGAWMANFKQPEFNNYRQNRQGDASAEELPDITGKLEDTACSLDGSDIVLQGTVCNRGLKAVAAALPATFYLGDPADGEILCVAYTAEPVPVGECREVSCPIGSEVSGEITMVVNDDGMGGALTVECIDTNNTDLVTVSECLPPG